MMIDETEQGKVKRSLSLPMHLTALFVTIIVFALGIWIGNYLALQVNQQFYTEIDSLQTNNVNLEFLSLLESDPAIRTNAALKTEVCAAVEQSAHNLGVQTADVGRRLRLFEQKRGDGADVLALQQRYFALEARDYFFWKKLKSLCNTTNLTLVIYFYRTECGECGDYDAAIGDFKQQNPPGILVYSFNLDHRNTTPSIAMLSSLYKVTSAPSVVVNDAKLIREPSVEEMQKLA
ncbi:MAG: hypothetical protein Q8R15_02655 [Candidatus Micrarchaeota archaeon]|nr:hypothetical protein [Candidatus Micrarchaeota archaeon]